ncbi:hypothetical protein N7457_006833 [Penicillium paradoxum]|uniref:uncharacterized protein n=1 Tax=Penicillium paradoxum TaxID=176176 RepID=UPI002546CD51|nr:uncharacterized protein N7457_006833 [Penicillium paradoxum]KAJ5779113.1 hypothetical protein N7457_006833 [Penicillium paradoxum]
MTTILFVPGAWISPTLYQPFLQALTVAGYEVHFVRYPSLNPEGPSAIDCQADTNAITGVLKTFVEDEGKDVLLLMYSYGAMPGAAAATGLAKSQRAQEGKAGGIIGLLFLAAFVVPEGLSCAGLQGGSLPPWVLLDQPSVNLSVIDDPINYFAADVEPALARSLNQEVNPHSTLAFTSPQPHPAWADEAFQGRLAFIVTTEDRAVPKEAQFGMVAATQKEWILKELTSSHCAPFLNRIDETVGLTREIIDQFL